MGRIGKNDRIRSWSIFTSIGSNRSHEEISSMSDLTSDAHGHEHPKHELSDHAKRIYAIRDLLDRKRCDHREGHSMPDRLSGSALAGQRRQARRPRVGRSGFQGALHCRSQSTPVRNSASMPRRSTNSSFSKTLRRCATWWFALYAPVIRGRYWAGRRTGTKASTTGNAQWSIRAG